MALLVYLGNERRINGDRWALQSFLTSTQNQDATNLNFTLADKDVDGEADGGSAGPNAAMASIHRYFREFDLVAFILLSSQLDCTNGEPEDASCLQVRRQLVISTKPDQESLENEIR